MGVIQNAINQALGTAGIAARLSPELEKKQELHRLGKQEESLKARREAATTSIRAKQKEGTLHLKDMEKDVDILQETAADVEQLRKRQFELDPSSASYEKYIKSKGIVKEGESLKQELKAAQDLLAKRQEQAMQKVAKKQDAKQNQKRNFMSYLKDQPTSFGGTVGDLPLKMQKAIAKQYSSADRKKLMNQMDMDKEKKDGTK